MAVDHYENFPVASILLPKEKQSVVTALYGFARSADDIADEGDASPAERQAQLQHYLQDLDSIEAGQTARLAVLQRLAPFIAEYHLSLSALRGLISAFIQDTEVSHYDNYASLLDYCSRSANPVGLLMLQIFKADNDLNRRHSDAICSALQLINFWQDIAIDYRKQRIYLPQEDLARFQLSAADIASGRISPAWQSMMRFQTGRARALMISGSSLAMRLPGRFGWELRLVVQGGLRILEKIDAVGGDVFNHRPTLGKQDWLLLLWRALTMKRQ